MFVALGGLVPFFAAGLAGDGSSPWLGQVVARYAGPAPCMIPVGDSGGEPGVDSVVFVAGTKLVGSRCRSGAAPDS